VRRPRQRAWQRGPLPAGSDDDDDLIHDEHQHKYDDADHVDNSDHVDQSDDVDCSDDVDGSDDADDFEHHDNSGRVDAAYDNHACHDDRRSGGGLYAPDEAGTSEGARGAGEGRPGWACSVSPRESGRASVHRLSRLVDRADRLNHARGRTGTAKGLRKGVCIAE
jgi:hypothetical protein